MKLNKTKKKKRLNQGNSFIVVIATISFLAVLVTALLVAVALCYRMKAYEINSRDNFYYLEKAMDEIYEGVGKVAMKHLNDSYNETLEVLVHYDTEKQSYVTMSDEDANDMMKQSFINKLAQEQVSGSLSLSNIRTTLDGFTSDGTVIIDDTNINVAMDQTNGVLKITNLVLKREEQYSTVNATKTAAPATYVQSITTDLVIAPPEYDVDFTNVGKDVDDLYDFVMISDMGVEVTGIGTKSVINGNVYAAADFYNKEYNGNPDKKVNSYDTTQLGKCDGISEKSMYSGFYVSGAEVSVIADKLVVPGTIAAMNCGKISVVGNIAGNASNYAKNWIDTSVTGYQNKAGYTQVWADGIVLGGYSRKLSGSAGKYIGSTIDMKADAYVYDDLEVNATGSQFSMDGAYYGYNYASTDNRTYSPEFIAAATKRKYISGVQINDGNYLGVDGTGAALKGQAHYNSSAIVVNGADSVLDLSKTDSIYIAGQAYVELSKTAQSKNVEEQDTGDPSTWNNVSNTTPEDKKVTVDNYSYNSKSDNDYTTTDAKDGNSRTSIQDYRTGEAISVKSNQLAYIPPYRVTEDPATGEIYVAWPAILENTNFSGLNIGVDFSQMWSSLSKVPVIKTVVSGKVNYFYDFSKAETGIKMNDYMEAYAALFEIPAGQDRAVGTMADFYDITDYELFKVDNLIIDGDDDYTGSDGENDKDDIENKIYSNSAISYKVGDKINIIADSKSVAVLTTAANELGKMDQQNLNNVATIQQAGDTTIRSTILTTSIQSEYKEMKMLLTNTSKDAYAVDDARREVESEITPINHHFDFSELFDGTLTMNSGYKVFMSKEDVIVEDGNSEKIKGIVICKGDVTFGSDVKEFEGLIVAGGKIKVGKSVNFVANAEVVKSILRECYDKNNTKELSQRLEPSDIEAKVCRLFKQFAANYADASGNPASEHVESMKSMSAVVYEDMISFANWKKNVD